VYSKIEETVALIRARCRQQPVLGLILGSGLGAYADSFRDRTVIPFGAIPHFPSSTVPGHSGNLIIGNAEGVPAVALQGRAHLYEGYSIAEVAYPARILGCLGIRRLIVTNAAGGINLAFQPGDVFYRDSSWRVPSSPSPADITTAEVDIWNTPNNSINDSVQTSAFLNDTWAVNSKLSVNLALRFDHYALGWPDQTATPNQSAIFQPITASAQTLVTLQSLSPRIGFAWDITGKGKTVLKGFYGKYAYNPSADVTNREIKVSASDQTGHRAIATVPCFSFSTQLRNR